NQDGTVNSATDPAVPGSFVSVYATGEGQTDAAGIDGKLAGPPLPRPIATPITATVGSINAQIQYAGGAPGFVAGVMQVNVQVSSHAVTTGNAAPLGLYFSGQSPQMYLTLAISASSAPRISSVSPSSSLPGQSRAVQSKGLFTNYVQGTTQAN